MPFLLPSQQRQSTEGHVDCWKMCNNPRASAVILPVVFLYFCRPANLFCFVLLFLLFSLLSMYIMIMLHVKFNASLAVTYIRSPAWKQLYDFMIVVPIYPFREPNKIQIFSPICWMAHNNCNQAIEPQTVNCDEGKADAYHISVSSSAQQCGLKIT